MFTFDAHFDGDCLRAEVPIALPQNVRLRVTVVECETVEMRGLFAPSGAECVTDLFGKIETKLGLIDGPPDWAAELDHYLYGTPKRGDVVFRAVNESEPNT